MSFLKSFAPSLFVLVAAFASAQTCQSLPASYTAINLGTLGGRASYGGGINSAGEVTGTSELSTLGSYDAFLWTPTGGMQDLGNLGGSESDGYAINSAGNVAGQAYLANGDLHAMLWTPTTGMQDLGLLYKGFEAFSVGQGIDDQNRVAGWQDDPQGTQAELFTGGKIYDLQKRSSQQFSSAHGISSKGQVVGDGKNDAVLWTKNGGLTHLGNLGTGHFSSAFGISYAGSAVAGEDLFNGNVFTALAWIRDTSTGKYVMDNLGPGEASAANDLCQVVGSTGPDGSTTAFAWTATDGMKDLNTLIPPNSGLILMDAFGINNSGQIVGTALDIHGDYAAYLLTPAQ